MGTRRAVIWLVLCASGLTLAPVMTAAEAIPCDEGGPAVAARAGLIRLREGTDPAAVVLPEQRDGGGAVAASGDDLLEVPGHSAAGGTTVNLRGRFRTNVGLRRATDGAVVGECTSSPTGSKPAD